MFVATFVRHGETKLNAAKIVQSRTHGELSERGIEMAEYLGRHLRQDRFTRVYSSDLYRCHQTTLNVLKHSDHPTPEPTLDPILRERDYGDLEFQPNQSIYDICNETGLDSHAIPLPGGEPYEETKNRVAKFFNMLCKLADASSESENALVVTHGAWLMCLVDHLIENHEAGNLELDGFEKEFAKMSPHNTSTTKLIIHQKQPNEDTKRKIQLIHIYDTTHLPEYCQRM